MKSGEEQIEAPSNALEGFPPTYPLRSENVKGTNPGELLAAAQAACFTQTLSNDLSERGHVPQEISTTATISQENGSISKMHLITTGRVEGLDNEQFKQMAHEAEKVCAVSNLLRFGLSSSLETNFA